MAEPLRLPGRWYWFRCPSCGWRGQRYRNTYVYREDQEG